MEVPHSKVLSIMDRLMVGKMDKSAATSRESVCVVRL